MTRIKVRSGLLGPKNVTYIKWAEGYMRDSLLATTLSKQYSTYKQIRLDNCSCKLSDRVSPIKAGSLCKNIRAVCYLRVCNKQTNRKQTNRKQIKCLQLPSLEQTRADRRWCDFHDGSVTGTLSAMVVFDGGEETGFPVSSGGGG